MEWQRTLIVSDIMSQEVGKPYQLFMHHVSTKIPKHLILQFQVGIGRQQSDCVKGCLVWKDILDWVLKSLEKRYQ